jgi:hypothetical protein
MPGTPKEACLTLRPVSVAWIVGLAALIPRIAFAQVTPAAGYTPPDDTPSIRVGVTIYADYTYQQSPDATDADGNVINPSSFNVSRSYINVTGNLSHIIAFRVTPDVVRESGLITLGPGNTLSNDSLVFRIKYAYAQFNLDDWMTRGSWARFGIQQTPLLDYEEGIYRYRFQGTTFTSACSTAKDTRGRIRTTRRRSRFAARFDRLRETRRFSAACA